MSTRHRFPPDVLRAIRRERWQARAELLFILGCSIAAHVLTSREHPCGLIGLGVASLVVAAVIQTLVWNYIPRR